MLYVFLEVGRLRLRCIMQIALQEAQETRQKQEEALRELEAVKDLVSHQSKLCRLASTFTRQVPAGCDCLIRCR